MASRRRMSDETFSIGVAVMRESEASRPKIVRVGCCIFVEGVGESI